MLLLAVVVVVVAVLCVLTATPDDCTTFVAPTRYGCLVLGFVVGKCPSQRHLSAGGSYCLPAVNHSELHIVILFLVVVTHRCTCETSCVCLINYCVMIVVS